MKPKAFVAVLVALLGGVLVGGTVLATPGAGASGVPLARGTNISDGTIAFQAGTDVLMSQVTFQPGGSSGWHEHPGGAVVVLKQGTITEYRSIGGQCRIATYGAGEALIERPGEVHQWINTGTDPAIAFVTFVRLAPGQPGRTDMPDPGTCPGV